MGKQQLAGWVLAVGVVLGVPVGIGMNQPQVVMAQSAELQEAERLNQKVIQLYNQGRYSEAIPLAQRSLAILEKALGPDHPDVATSLNNLAGLYESQGNYAQALPLRQRS
ncbi:MAG: tetratricopeptide repeat protein, partial [Gloeomargarita sp. HHBFW_bins_162]